jgi:Ala-tRNA(Pro) deacylase
LTSRQFILSQKRLGNIVAKAFIAEVNRQKYLVVIPADQALDKTKVGVLLDAEEVVVEEGDRTASLFPDCRNGVIPALGKPYDLPCLLDESILDWKQVLFDGGNDRESVQLSSDEYWRLAEAEVGDFRLRA